MRTSKTVRTSTTQDVWDPTPTVPGLLADYDGSGTLQRKYVWGLFGLAYNADVDAGDEAGENGFAESGEFSALGKQHFQVRRRHGSG